MLCDLCHKTIASVHLTEIIEDQVIEMHICQECAHTKSSQIQKKFDLTEMMSSFLDPDSQSLGKTNLQCKKCGIKYDQFKKKGRLGCAQCYDTFQEPLKVLLKRIQGTTRHIGKIPLQVKHDLSLQGKLRQLKSQLNKAIKLENYEEAVTIRDEVHRLENQIKKT